MSAKKDTQVIEIPTQRQSTQQISIVTRQDVDSLKDQRKLLKEFIGSQLKEANYKKDAKDYGEGDYGVIPGTKQKCLLKPGAEKLQRLFQLGCRFKQVDRIFDLDKNFAMLTYKAEIYSLNRPEVVIAECDASITSLEKKYKERTVWEKKRVKGKEINEQRKEQTPISDIFNTMIKMVQKRAMVGATILATGASDFFTQDMLEADNEAEENSEPMQQQAVAEKPEPVQTHGDDEAPMCCGRRMMVSKYIDKEFGHKPWFCLECKSKKARE